MSKISVHRRAKFSIIVPPATDPCRICVVKMVCNGDECVDKLSFNLVNPDSPKPIKIKSKKIKKVDFRRNINGIRN